MLRGAGVQKMHAAFKVDKRGQISIVVRGEEAHENTRVNGSRLPPAVSNFVSTQSTGLLDLADNGMTYTQVLNHRDRLCIGHSMLFLFRYPLQQTRRKQIFDQIYAEDPNIEPEEAEAQYEAELEEAGITDDPANLVCPDYSDE